MIYLGLDDRNKIPLVERYRLDHAIRNVVVISADAFPLPIPDTDQIKFSDVIMYVTFYRLLQEIGPDSLVVVNECLRTQNRYDLAYNCIRNFLNQTNHQIIFQQLPQIDTRDDFMILFDFDTKSRWKRHGFDAGLILDNAQIQTTRLPLAFSPVEVLTSPATKTKYTQERERLFATLGAKDPHTLPRNLYLIGGKDKLAHLSRRTNNGAQLSLFDPPAQPGRYVARNKRLNSPGIITYADVTPTGGPYTILELPHRFIDFSDFIKTTGQAQSAVLVADLKVDHWYFKRYTEWSERIHETYASL